MSAQRLRRNGATICNRKLGIRLRLAQPIGTGDDRLGELGVDRPSGLVDIGRVESRK
jgi:hypothetical protein